MPGLVVSGAVDSDAWSFDDLCHALPFVAWRARCPSVGACTRESVGGAAAGCIAAALVA
jgi:hypothetical protein